MEATNLALLSFKHGMGVLKMKKLLVKYDFKGNVKRKLTEVEKNGTRRQVFLSAMVAANIDKDPSVPDHLTHSIFVLISGSNNIFANYRYLERQIHTLSSLQRAHKINKNPRNHRCFSTNSSRSLKCRRLYVTETGDFVPILQQCMDGQCYGFKNM